MIGELNWISLFGLEELFCSELVHQDWKEMVEYD